MWIGVEESLREDEDPPVAMGRTEGVVYELTVSSDIHEHIQYTMWTFIF